MNQNEKKKKRINNSPKLLAHLKVEAIVSDHVRSIIEQTRHCPQFANPDHIAKKKIK